MKTVLRHLDAGLAARWPWRYLPIRQSGPWWSLTQWLIAQQLGKLAPKSGTPKKGGCDQTAHRASRRLSETEARDPQGSPALVRESPDVGNVNVSVRDRLQVHVNDELVLDAGTREEVAGSGGREWLIHPPETTLFHQVLAYLQAKPDPPVRPSGTMIGREAVAAAALVLRWGSYLAVLLDRDAHLARRPLGEDEPHQRRRDGADQHRGVGRARGVDRPLPRSTSPLSDVRRPGLRVPADADQDRVEAEGEGVLGNRDA